MHRNPGANVGPEDFFDEAWAMHSVAETHHPGLIRKFRIAARDNRSAHALPEPNHRQSDRVMPWKREVLRAGHGRGKGFPRPQRTTSTTPTSPSRATICRQSE